MFAKHSQESDIRDAVGLSFNGFCFAPLVWVFLLALPATALDNPHLHTDEAPTPGSSLLSVAQVNQAIALSAAYLERARGPDGKFAYKVDIGSGKESHSYDIIRHAGAMYALAMANRSHPDPQAVAALIRAAKFLRENYIGAGIRAGQEVVWSQPLSDNPEGRRSE